ncbi:glycosyltransferase [Enterobacteriaceae bacterium RIT691]|nr:glycosyltransferase [Enterobacteriaceae bacterium RIT691]
MNCTALIVTFNRLEKLKKTIEETMKVGFSHIMVVNNGSSDGTEDWLNTLTEGSIVVLNLPTNIGGAGGFKAGSQYICDNIPTDWVFFYDDDAYPESDIIKKFSKIECGKYEVYAAFVRDLKGNSCPMNLPFSKIPLTLLDTIRYIKNKERFIPAINKRTEVQTVSFVGMIIRSTLLKKNTKKIHDELFLYFDDLYFGYQLFLSGEKICYVPELIFNHDVSIQGKVISPEWKAYYLCRNLILSKHIFSHGEIYSNASICLRILKYTILIPWQKRRLKYIQYLFRGVKHGMQGISGKKH